MIAKFKMKFLGAALVAGLALSTGVASAATVSCGGPASNTVREFTLNTTPSSTCLASGTGNISGNPSGGNADPIFGIWNSTYGTNLTLIDKSDDTVSGVGPNALTAVIGSLVTGLSGSFSFLLPAAPAGQVWTDLVIAFKSGSGMYTGGQGRPVPIVPEWAAFVLPAGVTSGSWTISGQQALSHVNLYGRLVNAPPPPPIPLPASGLLLVTGLAALAIKRRKA